MSVIPKFMGGEGFAPDIPELPEQVANLVAWVSTTKGTFVFEDASSIPAHGKAVQGAFDVGTGASVFAASAVEVRPTWDDQTFDIAGLYGDGSQYLSRGLALPAPGLIIVASSVDAAGTAGTVRALFGVRSTATPGGAEPRHEAFHLNKSASEETVAQVATDTVGAEFVDTPAFIGEKTLIAWQLSGGELSIWELGNLDSIALSGTPIAADADQVLLARFFDEGVVAIFKGHLFDFAQYSVAPARQTRRALLEYFRDLLWPGVPPPAAASVDLGNIEQGGSGSANVVTPSTGTSLVAASIDEQPTVGSASVSTDSVLVSVPAGAALGPQSGWYCLRSEVVGSRLFDFGQFSFNIVEASGGSELAEEQPLPTPLNTIVGTTTNFNGLLGSGGSAQPGDRINLNNGDYGARTIAVSGTQANPIVVRAANLHQATTGTLTVTGNWVIVSGLDIAGPFLGNGSNIRCTRCLIHGSSLGFQAGPGVHDILIDHCEIYETVDRMFYLDDPKDQQRIIVARCWCHSLSSGGSTPGSHGFLWADENVYRENPHDYIIVRLNYVGPGLSGDASSDWVHDKQSDSIYAFNRWDQSGKLISLRFGLRKRFVGNYAPGMSVNMFDDLGWYYGNICGELRAMAGRSAYYDDTKNLAGQPNNSVGGFHATKRTRIAGNTGSILLPWPNNGPDNNWCTRTDPDPATLPDPQPCGVSKPARTFNGITYAADNPNDPDKGIKIRNHSGTITLETATCVNIPGDGRWYTNIDSQTSAAAPAGWLTDLLAEHPWIGDICPNPTSSTGGPGNTHPSSIAQELTRGDNPTPNTGPFRASPGGLP